MSKLSILLALVGAIAAMELTPDNWDEQTAGKTVFIKFLAPWCGHCKKLKPTWDKLMKAYDGKKDALIADVDCTAAGKPLCDQVGVKGYPTLKWGSPDDLQDYSGGRGFDELKKFADENLKPICAPGNLDLCEDEDRKKIEEIMAMDEKDLQAKIDEGEKKMSDAEETFQTKLSELQATYQEIMKTKDDTIEDVKKSGLGMLKGVLSFKKSQEADKEEEAKDEL